MRTAEWRSTYGAIDEMTPEPTPDAPRASQNRPGYFDPETLAELQRLARSRPRSGRQAAAKASAIRTLERLERSRGRPMSDNPAVLRLFADDRDPDEQVRGDDWHPTPDAPIAALDAHDTVKARRTWYLNLAKRGRIGWPRLAPLAASDPFAVRADAIYAIGHGGVGAGAAADAVASAVVGE